MPRSIPLYRQIKQHLLDRIALGEWAVGTMIPAEEQLARDFGVSRMTAHKAIRDLVQQGCLTRQAGVGTFVTGAKAESSLIEVRNIAEEVRARGHGYSNEVLKAETVTATEGIAARLELRPGDQVFHTLILHCENDVPIQLEDRYVNPAAVPDYLSDDFSKRTPNEVLVAAAAISDVEHLGRGGPGRQCHGQTPGH